MGGEEEERGREKGEGRREKGEKMDEVMRLTDV